MLDKLIKIRGVLGLEYDKELDFSKSIKIDFKKPIRLNLIQKDTL